MVVAQLGLFGLAVWLSPNEIRFANIDAGSLVPFLLSSSSWSASPPGWCSGSGGPSGPPAHRARRGNRLGALRSPRRLAFLIGGNVLTAVFYGFCLQACLAAFGATLSFWSLLAADRRTPALSAPCAPRSGAWGPARSVMRCGSCNRPRSRTRRGPQPSAAAKSSPTDWPSCVTPGAEAAGTDETRELQQSRVSLNLLMAV